MVAAAVHPSQPPPSTSLTAEERARVEAYRVQFHAMGLTDDDIARMNEPAPPEEQAAFEAWLHGDGLWPSG